MICSLPRLLALWFGCFFLVGQALGEDLTISGSGNPEYVFGEMAKAFNARQSQHRIIVPPSIGMAGAIRDVSEGVTSLGRTGRPLNEAEKAKGLIYLPVGRDAVVAAAGAAVTVKGISTAQLVGLFEGKLSDWKELGGKPGPVRAIGKEATDTVRIQLSKHIRDINFGENVKIVHRDPLLLELLDRYPTSFAIINRSALGACKTRVVVLALDGVDPMPINVENGSYPLTMEFGLVHKRNGLTAAGKAFLEFIDSADGVAILRRHGVLPLRLKN